MTFPAAFMKNSSLNTSSLLYSGLLYDDPQQEYGAEALVHLSIAGTRDDWNRGFTTLPWCVRTQCNADTESTRPSAVREARYTAMYRVFLLHMLYNPRVSLFPNFFLEHP